MVCFLKTFPYNPTIILPFFLFFLQLSPISLIIVISFYSPFPNQIIFTLVFTFPFPTHPTTLGIVCVYSPVFAVTPGYRLSCEDLEVGVSNVRDHVTFIFLCLDYLTQYHLFQFSQLPEKFMISFFYS